MTYATFFYGGKLQKTLFFAVNHVTFGFEECYNCKARDNGYTEQSFSDG